MRHHQPLVPALSLPLKRTLTQTLRLTATIPLLALGCATPPTSTSVRDQAGVTNARLPNAETEPGGGSTAGSSNSSSQLTIRDDLRPQIIDLLENKHKATAAIAVVMVGTSVHSSTYGHLNLEKTKAVDENTYFRMGSVTKVLTAAAIMKLAQEGKIDLNEPVRTYLPWFKVDGDEKRSAMITVQHLLGHTSGLSREFGCVFSSVDGKWIPLRSVENCVRTREIHFQPGEELKYSNLGYNLLGQIIATQVRPSKKPIKDVAAYSNYMVKNVLHPLGMTTAKFILSPEDLSQAADPLGPVHADTGKRSKLMTSSTALENTPSYYLALTIKDFPPLLRFLRQIGRREASAILRADTQQKMFDQRTKDLFTNYEYGLGLTIAPDVGGRFMIGHSGGAPGYRSFAFYDTQSDVGVAVVTNTHDQAARDIANLLFKNYSATAQGSIATIDSSPATPDFPIVESPFNGTFEMWARQISFFTVDAKAEGNKKTFTLDILYDGKRRRMEAVPGYPLKFRIPKAGPYNDSKGEIIEFKKKPDGSIDELIMSNGYQFKRVK